MLNTITPLVLTLNEEPNIGRCLERLRWAREVVVVDSLSADRTKDIATSFPNVRFVERPFDVLATQWNFGVNETGITSEWILALDADYIANDAFIEELSKLVPGEAVSAYEARFTYCMDGRPLRASLYPPVRVLFRRPLGTYIQDGHAHRLVTRSGVTEPLRARLAHDDRKSAEAWRANQEKYMALEAVKLRSAAWEDLGWPDRVRKLVFVAPVAAFVYAAVIRGTMLDGRAGMAYALQRMQAEWILSKHLLRAS